MAAWISAVLSLILKRLKEKQDHDNGGSQTGFMDISNLPPELSLSVLSHLNATDLCLAACVWRELAQDEVLWQSLCRSQWGYVSIYNKLKREQTSYHRLYLLMDEGTVTFNADPFLGMEYFIGNNLVENSSVEIAKFFHHTHTLHLREMRSYLNIRRDVLDHLIDLHNYKNQSLPNALRRFFRTIQAPNEHDNYLHTLLEKFSARFCKCNPKLGMTSDMVYLLCFSLIMLSVDLSSPHVKNKMSKREFIRNVRHAVQRSDDEFFGHLYDDVYVQGHIAPNSAD